MSDEKCENCGKRKSDHYLSIARENGRLYCSNNMNDVSEFMQPAPQAVLFDASAVRTGYEL